MARGRSILRYWGEYLAARSLAGFMGCFDVHQNLSTAGSIGSMFYRSSRRHRERAQGHLRLSFPGWTDQRIAWVAEQSMRNMFQIFMVDAMVTPRLITRTSWPRYVSVGRLHDALRLLIRREPAIFITGHCGNWELLGYALAVLDYPLYALARPLDNPLLNDWVLGIREARGMRIITKFGATPIIQDLVESGGRVAFIADQNAGDGGLFVPFFGRLASTYKSIGLLAMRYRVPIVVGVARRLGDRFEYELSASDVIRPDEWVDRPDPLFYITARYNRAFEQLIATAPEQYLWVHRRWKSRPHHERLGKPMPRRIVAKLQELPWMTPGDIDRIVEHSNETAARYARGEDPSADR